MLTHNPQVKVVPSRFKNKISKYRLRRNSRCLSCGTCVHFCPVGVHLRPDGYNEILSPREENCLGFVCLEKDFCCVKKCPRQALVLEENPVYRSLGDFRWTADLLRSTWYQAETGKMPPSDWEAGRGNSEGGFDRLEFNFPPSTPKIPLEEISTAIDLNKRNDSRLKISIDLPIYGGGMSFGSTSLAAILSRAKAAYVWNTFTCTGEGGYPEELTPYDNHIITQVATGLFGVREETIQRVRMVEFKYAQGAKPGLGGHLLGKKVTPIVARMRESVPGTSLFSPFPFHSVYSIEDHKKHIDWVKQINPRALVSVKVSTPTDVDMVAVGSYFAGAHIVHLDGSYGGTGAAPQIAKKNIAMPIEYAIPKVHKFLLSEGVRDKITLIASGGIRTPDDMIKVICLGADGVVLGTTELVALECVRCGNCESDRGCARGITTTDPELSSMIDVEWGAQRLINLYFAWYTRLKEVLQKFGLKSVKQLVGRIDFLKIS